MRYSTLLFIRYNIAIIGCLLCSLNQVIAVEDNALEPFCGVVVDYDFSSTVKTPTLKQPIIVTANIEKTPMAITQDGVLVKYDIKNFTFVGLSPAENAEQSKTISTTIYVVYKSNGMILALYGVNGIPAWHYNTLKSIVLGLQVVKSLPNLPIKNYQVQEQDDKGTVIADYEIISAQLLKKHRQSYKSLWTQGVDVNLDYSDTSIHLDVNGIIQSIATQERISLGSQQQLYFTGEYAQQLTLKHINVITPNATCPYTSLDQAQAQAHLMPLPFANITNEYILDQYKLQRLTGVNFNDLINNLLSNDNNTKNPAATIPLLVDLFTYYPGHLNKVLELLQQHQDNHQFTGYLIASVANAKTPASQPILLTVMQQFGKNSYILIQSILAHHNVATPAMANAEYLIKLYNNSTDQEFKNIVILAIGSLAQKLDTTKTDAQPHTLTLFLINQLYAQKSSPFLTSIIEAIGNSRDAYAFFALRELIETVQDPRVIGTAVQAIKKMPADKIRPMLETMLEDKNENVVLAAILALQDGPLLSAKSIHQMINSYSNYSIYVKLEALALLLEHAAVATTSVSKFIDERKANNQFSTAELKIINTQQKH